ncbi:hypothetical protein ACP3V3_17485 [Vibrio sp. PNB22_3_1]
MTIRTQIQQHIDSSVHEILSSVGTIVESEIQAKKDLAQSTTEIIEIEPANHNHIQEMIEKSTLKSGFLTIALGYDKNGFLLENDDSWEADASFDQRPP